MKKTTIRLFISSTFVDMQQERNYLMGVIVPRLSALCSEKGLNFFCYDLRWGITDEEQKKNGTITPCLKAVDDSRPFFVGIIGERYGWIPPSDECEVLKDFSFDASDVSITEMEIMYGALNMKNDGFCSFYFRDKAASGDFIETDPKISEKLTDLKNRIRSSGYPYLDGYKTPEEFGERLYLDFKKWLEQNAISGDDVEYNKQKSYAIRQCDYRLGAMALENDIPRWLGEGRPLFIRTLGTSLDALLYTNPKFTENPSFDSIFLSLRASTKIRYSEEIIRYLLNRIEELYPGCVESEYLDYHSGYAMTYSERQNLYSYFGKLCRSLKVKKSLYIFIFDVDLLQREADKTLYFLNNISGDNINFLVTSRNSPHLGIMDMSGWHTRQITLEDVCEILMTEKLSHAGKCLTQEQLAKLRGAIHLFDSYDRMDLVSSLLTSHVTHDELDNVIEQFAFMLRGREVPIVQLVEDVIVPKLTPLELELLYDTYAILKEANLHITEDELYRALSLINKFSSLEWSRFISITSPLFPITEGAITITNSCVAEHIMTYAMALTAKSEDCIQTALITARSKRVDIIAAIDGRRPTTEEIALLREYYLLCQKNCRYSMIDKLFGENMRALCFISTYDPGLIRVIMRGVEEHDAEDEEDIQGDLFYSFNDNFDDILGLFLDILGEDRGRVAFGELFSNLKSFDKQDRLSRYPTVHSYIMYRYCDKEFISLYSELANELVAIDSQVKLDAWYNKASAAISKYTVLSSIESTFAFKLMSLYSTSYASADFAVRMSTFFLASAFMHSEYDWISAIYQLSRAYKKSYSPGEHTVAESLRETAELLSKEYGHLGIML